MAAETKLGTVAFIDKGIYSDTATYSKWSMVTTEDSTYISLVDGNTGNPVTDETKWKCIARGTQATAAAKIALTSAAAANKAQVETVNAITDAGEVTERMNSLADHRDKIVDGYWWRWNEINREYEKTEHEARGNVMFATFDVNPNTGELEMNTDEDYTGGVFALSNEGILSIEI